MPKTNFLLNLKIYTSFLSFIYERLKGIIACISCIILILFLNSNNKFSQYSKNEIVTHVRSFFYKIINPIITATSSINNFSSFFITKEEYELLQNQNTLLRSKVLEYEIKLSDLESLKLAASFKESSNYNFFLSTRLIDNGYDLNDMSYIPVGTDNSVEENDILLNQYGLVGRVVAPYLKTSNIMLITDRNSKVPALIIPEQQKCIISGNGTHTNLLKVSFLPPNFRFHNEQSIITSGEGRIFPYGLKIAEITAKNDEHYIKAEGLANHLEFVHLLKKD